MYVDLLSTRLAVSIQRCVSSDWVEGLLEEAANATGEEAELLPAGLGGALWMTNLVDERVPVALLRSVVNPVCPGAIGEASPVLAGEVRVGPGGAVSWKRWVVIPTWHPSPDPVAVNSEHLPVANMSLVTWGDKYQTFRRRVHSTTMFASTYSSLPFELRNSHAFIRIISCTPPEVCELTAFRTIFGCLRQLEAGVSMPCRDQELAPKGEVFVRAGLQASLADSPFQNKQAYGLGPTSNTPCPLDYLTVQSNPFSDKVRVPSTGALALATSRPVPRTGVEFSHTLYDLSPLLFAQVGVGDPDNLRDKNVSASLWRQIREDLVHARDSLTNVIKRCREAGMPPACVQGIAPPSLLHELKYFDFEKQLLIDLFHNWAEGHCSLFVDLFKFFSSEAEEYIRCAWEDRQLWDPSTGK